MTDPEKKHELSWLLEPPSPEGAHVHIVVGDKSKLPQKALAALEAFAKELELASGAKPSVEGIVGSCPGYTICDPLGRCNPETGKFCNWYTTCRIDR